MYLQTDNSLRWIIYTYHYYYYLSFFLKSFFCGAVSAAWMWSVVSCRSRNTSETELHSFMFLFVHCRKLNEIKLEKVPFWAQVSIRPGQVVASWWRYNRPMWKECYASYAFDGSWMIWGIWGFFSQKCALQKSTCWWRYNRPMWKEWDMFLSLV